MFKGDAASHGAGSEQDIGLFVVDLPFGFQAIDRGKYNGAQLQALFKPGDPRLILKALLVSADG